MSGGLITNEYLGVYLAGIFGLHNQYFKDAYTKKVNINASLRSVNGFVFVKLPDEVVERIEDGYIAYKVEDQDNAEYEHLYKLTRSCTIGFWK